MVRLTTSASTVRNRMSVAIAILLVAAMCLAATVVRGASSAAAAEPPVVNTLSGPVVGLQHASGAKEWRGIPYAAPPIGPLRWRAPQPPAPWSEVRPADEFAAPCIQPDFEGGTIGSEDCLYLNVFAPPASNAESNLPVMVHLHGGGNGVGRGYEQAVGLVRHDVIVVTLNYRLGVFGFLGHPALSAQGDLPEQGLLDQIAALEWVQDNIAAFGGSRANVTLFGLSAGSYDAAALLASPLTAGLVHRGILQTANFWSVTGVGNSLADKEDLGIGAAQLSGCDQVADVPSCLRSIPAEAFVAGAFEAMNGPFDTGPLVGGTVLPQTALRTFQERGAGVPLLIGNTREETSFWFYPEFPEIPNGELVRHTTDLVGPSNTGRALKLYPKSDYDSNLWVLVAMLTDGVFTCPTRQLGLAASSHGATYRYLYTHVMENDPVAALFRAGHAWEESFVWHDFNLWGYSPSAAEEQLSETMSSYWTNFAKAGDPNAPGLPVWPQYQPGAERYLDLDDQVREDAAYHVAQCGLMDSLTTPFPTCNSLCHFFETAQWWHRSPRANGQLS